MGTHSVEFDVIPGNYGGKEGPYEARFWIALKSQSKEEERTLFLSHECRTISELEFAIDLLLKEQRKSMLQYGKKILDEDDKAFRRWSEGREK